MEKTAGTSQRKYGGQTAEERLAVRRARLLAATISVLGEVGEDATTMTAICARASLTERYFYESFTNRDAALIAALDLVAERIAALTVAAVNETSGSASDRVRAALTALVAWAASEPAQARVALVESYANAALRTRRHQLIGDFASLVATEATGLYGDGVHSQVRVNGLLFAAGFAELVEAWMNDRLQISNTDLVDLGSEAFERLARA